MVQMMKKLFSMFICLFYHLLLTAPASADTARETFEQFKRLEAHLTIGMSYNDYVRALGDIEYYVDRFDRETDQIFSEMEEPSQETKRLAELRVTFVSCKISLRLVKAQWEKKILSGKNYEIFKQSSFWKHFFERHPEANAKIENGGVLGFVGKRKVVYTESVMKIIWNDVWQNLKDAEKHFS